MLKTIVFSLGLALCAIGGGLYLFIQPPAINLAPLLNFTLTDVTVINPGLSRRQHQRIVVQHGSLVESAPNQPGRTELAEYAGHYVLPGLIDNHAHLVSDNVLNLGDYISLLYLAHGVTSIRDALDIDGSADAAMWASNSPAPRLYSCGAPFGGAPALFSNYVLVNDVQLVESQVLAHKNAGFSCIKSYDNLTPKLVNAVKLAARQHGLPVIGHVPITLSYEQALLDNAQHYFGVPLVEDLGRQDNLARTAHWQNVDQHRLDTIVQLSKTQGLTNTPTLVVTQQLMRYQNYASAVLHPQTKLMPNFYPDVVWHPQKGLPFYRHIDKDLALLPDALAKKQRLTQQLYQAGAPLQLGTDSGQPFVVPGLALQQEMQLFVDSGIPTEAVWAIATRENAKDLALKNLGKVQIGAPADFLIFSQDPSSNLDNLNTLVAVAAAGKLYKMADIQASIKQHQIHFARPWYRKLSNWAAARALAGAVNKQPAH